MGVDKFCGLDWGVMLLNLYSYYLIGNKKKFGFILGIVGCIAGLLMFTLITSSIPMILMYICFGILNVINYLKWKQNK